jgi:hypothetical protein
MDQQEAQRLLGIEEREEERPRTSMISTGVGSNLSFRNNSMLINGLPVQGHRSGSVSGSVIVRNGTLTIGGQSYVVHGGEWVPDIVSGGPAHMRAVMSSRMRQDVDEEESSDESDDDDDDEDNDERMPADNVATTCRAASTVTTASVATLGSLLELEGNAEKTDVESSQCAICMENKKTIVFHPCRHLCCCVECARNLFDKPLCPLCKTIIKTAEAVFI